MCRVIDDVSLCEVAAFGVTFSADSESIPDICNANGFLTLALVGSSLSTGLALRYADHACGVVSHATITFLNGRFSLLSTLCLTSSSPRTVRVTKSSIAFFRTERIVRGNCEPERHAHYQRPVAVPLQEFIVGPLGQLLPDLCVYPMGGSPLFEPRWVVLPLALDR